MSTLRMSLAGAVMLALLGSVGAVAVLGQDDIVGPASEPFDGMLVGSVNYEPLAATDECPFGVRTITDATGNTSHLGVTSAHTEHCATAGMPNAPNGEVTLAGEGGDELTGTYFVDCLPLQPTSADPLITCTGRIEISGGSGRYTEATGTLDWDASVWFPGSLQATDWPWFSTLEGSISY